MGTICIETISGRLREWARHGVPASFDPATHTLIPSDDPPPDAMRWDGAGWVPLPPKTDMEKDTELQAFLDSAAGRVMKAVVAALVKKGVITLAEIRTEYRSLNG